MVQQAEWYFDFVSPFSYLQLECFGRLPDNVQVVFRPIVFAGLLNHWQHKAELRGNGERAIAANLFGVPSFVIDGEIFWGFDATGIAVDYLKNPASFATGERARVSSLPIGVERRFTSGQTRRA